MNQSLNIPSHSDLFESTIKALKSLGGSGTVQEIGVETKMIEVVEIDQKWFDHL